MMDVLIEDVEAVIHQLGYTSACIVSHDWGGIVAWRFAYARPHMVERLVVLNCPHPAGMKCSSVQQLMKSW